METGLAVKGNEQWFYFSSSSSMNFLCFLRCRAFQAKPAKRFLSRLIFEKTKMGHVHCCEKKKQRLNHRLKTVVFCRSVFFLAVLGGIIHRLFLSVSRETCFMTGAPLCSDSLLRSQFFPLRKNMAQPIFKQENAVFCHQPPWKLPAFHTNNAETENTLAGSASQ